MALSERYGDDYDNLDEEMPFASTSSAGNIGNPFEGTISYGAELLDSAGNQVMFSAGEVPAVEKLDDLWRQIENLDYCDHTIFADMTPMMADLFDKPEDCTVSDAVRAMEAMGKSSIPCRWMVLKSGIPGIDDSDEEDADDTGSGEFDEDWAPHGSKCVGGVLSFLVP
jgi:hypothetical protein